MSDTMPSREQDALDWMETFSAGIHAAPGKYLLSVPDADLISSVVGTFRIKYGIANKPETRTSVSIAEKDDARATAEQVCRQYANGIKYNTGISDPDKIAIGVKPVNPHREPAPAPSTSALLNVIAATPGAHTVRYADSMSPDKAAKPAGVTELQLFVAIGPADEPITDPEAAKFYGKFTKNPVAVMFEHADNGKLATYFARWANRKGQVGPWSAGISMAIAA